MVKHTQAIGRRIADKQPTNCVSEFDHFVRLALKGLNFANYSYFFGLYRINKIFEVKIIVKMVTR